MLSGIHAQTCKDKDHFAQIRNDIAKQSVKGMMVIFVTRSAMGHSQLMKINPFLFR